MPRENKVTKLEKESRLLMIEKLMLMGQGCAAIKKFVSTQTKWNISGTQVERYIYDVRVKWGGLHNKREIDDIRAEHLALRWDGFRHVREKGFMRLSLEYLKDIAELEGLYNLEQRKVQSKESELLSKISGKIDEMEPEEILGLFRKIDEI